MDSQPWILFYDMFPIDTAEYKKEKENKKNRP